MTAGAGNSARVAIRCDAPGPRFLGRTAAERNLLVAKRAAERDLVDSDGPATLTIPATAIITSAVFKEFPPPPGVRYLDWAPDQPALVWRDDRSGASGRTTLPAGTVLDVSTWWARRRAVWQLLQASGKPTDGWLSRRVHRPISRVCSYALLHTVLTANHASLLTFLVGAASAWFMAQTSHRSMILGALLFWFASIADGIDGEMARTRMTESARGEQIDTAVDHATHVLVFAGVLIGWWRQGIGAGGLALMVIIAAGLPMMFLGTMALVRTAIGSRQFFVDTKPIEGGIAQAAADTSSPVLAAAAKLWVVFRREALALLFFVVSLPTGARAAYAVLVAVGLAIVGVVLTIYRRPIARAIAHQHAQA